MKQTVFSRLAALAFVLAMLALLIVFAGSAFADEAQPPRPEAGVQWSGVLDSFSADQWVIAGQAVAINEQTVIRVTGTLATGMWVEANAARDGDALIARRLVANPPAMSLRGAVSVIPEGRIGQWIIGGQAFQVTADTLINERGEPIAVGSWVQVIAQQEGGALVARRIRGIHALPAVEVMGALQAVSATAWTVSGIDIALNSATLVNGDARVGLLAQVAADLQDDSSLLAVRARVLWHELGSGQEPATLTGVIEELPEQGLAGRWLVDGVVVAVTPNTRIHQMAGAVTIGAEVRIVGRMVDDVLAAREIAVISSPVSGEAVRFVGPIEAMPTGGLAGDWTIGGQTVQVSATTRIEGARLLRVGVRVQVVGLRQSSGVVVATELAARLPRPGAAVDQPLETVTQ
ncbi:MAG: DUF5666 domain-containing protein [Caldilineales bacterium]